MRNDVNQVVNYSLGIAMVGGGTVFVKGAHVLFICAMGKKYIKIGEEIIPLSTTLAHKKSAIAELFSLAPKRMDDFGEGLINGLEAGNFHSTQLQNFRLMDANEHSKLLQALEAEGRDVYPFLRNKDYPILEKLADCTADAEKRLSLSDILKNMSQETLGKLEADLAGEGGDVLMVYFKEKVGGVKTWERFFAGNSDDAIRKSTEWLERLSDDLSHPTWGEEIAQFLDENPADVKDVWKKLKDDPAYHWELYDSEGFEIGSRWDKWSKREFFKSVTKKGKDFELDLLNKMRTRSGVAYSTLKNKVADLDDRYLVSQMQFCRPGLSPPCNKKGEYFIADQVWIKYDEEGDIIDMVIVDSKLSYGTSFTPGQTAAKNNVGGNLSFKPSLSIETDINDQLLPSSIIQGLEIKTSSFYKAYGDGDKTFINIE